MGERRIALKRTLFGIEPGGGVLPYMGYIGTCRGIGYGFRGSRSLNRVSFSTLERNCMQSV